jgi:hypothetical protein
MIHTVLYLLLQDPFLVVGIKDQEQSGNQYGTMKPNNSYAFPSPQDTDKYSKKKNQDRAKPFTLPGDNVGVAGQDLQQEDHKNQIILPDIYHLFYEFSDNAPTNKQDHGHYCGNPDDLGDPENISTKAIVIV